MLGNYINAYRNSVRKRFSSVYYVNTGNVVSVIEKES